MHTSNIDPKQIGYSWVPAGIVTSSKIQKYFDLLPKEKVPKIGSVGERYRIKQLNYQLPKQDIDYAYCKHVGLDRECFEEFVSARNEIALDIGYIKESGTSSACASCEEQINQGELAVNATKFSNRVIWHPRCFQCCVCKELLVDLTYCAFEDKIFCERHYAEIFKPRCNACDEGTADKPTSKTSCENDQNAAAKDACELLDNVNNDGLCTLNSIDEKIAEENLDACDIQPNQMIKKIENLPNLHQYFNDALKGDAGPKIDAMTPTSPILIDRLHGVTIPETNTLRSSRDTRSTTVHSRSSDSDESSNIAYNKSISRDSSSTYTEYNRTDSCNSFIQDELDSEEYHHHHRFSMTADTLEYIRGREDWRAHTENKLNSQYRRLSSNSGIREEIDSDEYHHDRKLSELIEIAYLDIETIKSLPSSFDGGKVFDRYYLELQQIKGQLTNDIERNVAQKQVILLDSTEAEQTDGYLYPLPDIILDQVSDHGDDTYTVEQLDSDYSNVSESEDDVQSVIEVINNNGSPYAGELITTFDMNADDDEMIEVTLWDLNDDATRDFSSKESSVEIINLPNEYPANDMPSSPNLHTNETSGKSDSEREGETANKDVEALTTQLETTENSGDVTAEAQDSRMETAEDTSKNAVKVSDVNNAKIDNSSTSKDQPKTCDTNNIKEVEKSPINSESPLQLLEAEDKLLGTIQTNTNRRPPTGKETSRSFIEHESLSSAKESTSTTSPTNDTVQASKKTDKTKNKRSSVDELIMEGCMGVWFHN